MDKIGTGDMLKRLRQGSRRVVGDGHRAKGAHPDESERRIEWFVPSLAATLLDREKKKGSPLAKSEVIRIRDRAPAILVSFGTMKGLLKRRGYEDIDPENAWNEWQVLRRQFHKTDGSRPKRAASRHPHRRDRPGHPQSQTGK